MAGTGAGSRELGACVHRDQELRMRMSMAVAVRSHAADLRSLLPALQ